MLRSAVAALSLFAIPSAFGQMAISMHSGLIHHVEGEVLAEGQRVKLEYGKFPVIKEGQAMTTHSGKAELLLTPGVFLRAGENSSIKMISSALSDTRVDVLQGEALVEVVEIGKDHKVTIKMGESQTPMTRPGLYLFDADNSRIRVYEGKAQVSLNEESMTAGKGHDVLVQSSLVAGKFNPKDVEDPLYDWSQQRAYLVARANVSAANSSRASGYRPTSSGWAWFGDMGLLTYLPRSGSYRGAFGWSFYSPSSVWQFYSPRNNDYGGYNASNRSSGNTQGAWNGLGADSSRSSSVMSSAASSSQGARASAPAAAPAVSAPSGGRGR